MRADLGQQSIGMSLSRLAEEHGMKAQPAANGLLEDSDAFDGAIPRLGQLGVRECSPHFFHQGIVSPLDPPEAFWRGFP